MTNFAVIAPENQLFKNACRVACNWAIHQYLQANAGGCVDFAAKSTWHIELCNFYVATFYGLPDGFGAGSFYPEAHSKIHSETQELTGYLDTAIGFPIRGIPDYDQLASKFFEIFHTIAMATLESQH